VSRELEASWPALAPDGTSRGAFLPSGLASAVTAAHAGRMDDDAPDPGSEPPAPAALVKQAMVLRLYPSAAQAKQMLAWMTATRALWNHLHGQLQATYAGEKRFLSLKELEKLRQSWDDEEDPAWRQAPPAQTMQRVVKELRGALDTFLASRSGKRKGPRMGFPRKKKRKPGGVFYVSNQGLKVEDGRVSIPKLGWIRVRNQRPLGKIQSARVRLVGDRWFLAVQHEAEAPPRVLGAPSEPVIGVDVGVRTLAARSDGKDHAAPRPLRRLERRLRRLSRRMSKRVPKPGQRASRRFREAACRVAKLQGRIADVRKDAQHVASIRIVAKAAVIGRETLNIKGMARSRLAKSVADAGMGELHRQIDYKAGWHGRKVVKLKPFERSTGVCPRPGCGVVGPKLPLHVRRWTCAGCGAKHERDAAAAEHIAAVAAREVGPVRPEPAAVTLPKAGEPGCQDRVACPSASVPGVALEVPPVAPLAEPTSLSRGAGAGGEPPHPRLHGRTRQWRRAASQPELELTPASSPGLEAGCPP
jgi:transposase